MNNVIAFLAGWGIGITFLGIISANFWLCFLGFALMALAGVLG